MKHKKYFQILLFLAITVFTMNSYGQQAENTKRKQHSFYRRTLQVDSAKAAHVTTIQDQYKAGLKTVIADTSLNEAAKRLKIEALINAKNQQLRLLLSPAQQEKIIPTTERRPIKLTSN